MLELITRLDIDQVPEDFNEEVKDHMGLNEPIRDSEDEFIDQVIKPLGEGAKDDPPEETAFKNMQEIVNTHFGGFDGMTKQEYAAQIEEIDKHIEEERRHEELKRAAEEEQLRTQGRSTHGNLSQEDSPHLPMHEQTRSTFSQNTSAMFPDAKGYRGQLPINSPYRDYMFEHNKT